MSHSIELLTIRHVCEDIMDTDKKVIWTQWTHDSVVKLAQAIRDLALMIDQIEQRLPDA